MKVWVCRDENGKYSLIESKCNPSYSLLGWWDCDCSTKMRVHYVVELDPGEVKKMMGLKSHIRTGTKKLMTWTLPLARQPKGKE